MISSPHDPSYISLVPIFQGLQQDEIQDLQKVTQIKEYQKGEWIFREGESSDTLYLISEGLIKITKVAEDGKEQIVRLLFPGDFFGQSAMLQTENHYANAVAINDTLIYTIHKHDFLNTLERNHKMALRFMRALNERIYQADEWMSLLSLMEVEQRLASVLLLFNNRMQAKDGKFTLPISKKVLASLIGTTPETISRKLVLFVSNNLIELHGQRDIHILDIEGLKKKAKLH
ncbi:Crp/Fnr family transcriptional regulator [Fredinandcohnia sp. 179-A 10B2 NHS]|uniref:Crp/Fnr family transcriptional regulator n=1 Tax=Fredinandcohnia sp. 179-A 10B2 NHS TaxID=3235176 RepID=UPI0039A16EAD